MFDSVVVEIGVDFGAWDAESWRVTITEASFGWTCQLYESRSLSSHKTMPLSTSTLSKILQNPWNYHDTIGKALSISSSYAEKSDPLSVIVNNLNVQQATNKTLAWCDIQAQCSNHHLHHHQIMVATPLAGSPWPPPVSLGSRPIGWTAWTAGTSAKVETRFRKESLQPL